MAKSDSKVPYLLAAGAIGGAVGYLFLTESGKRLRDSVFNMETTSAIPDKIEEFRLFIEKRGNEVGGRIRGVVDHLKDSVEEGKRAFEQGGTGFHDRMEALDRTGNEVVSNIHRAIDNLNRTIHTVEETILEPLYQCGAIVKAVDSGVRRLVRSTERGFGHERNMRSFYNEAQRKMG